MLNLKKKENDFFIYLKEFSNSIVEAGNDFSDLVHHYDYENLSARVAQMKDHEHKCDCHAHKILTAIHGSFVTPFDREDLFAIVKEMDNIMDALEQVSSRFAIFDIKEPNDACREMTELIIEGINALHIVFDHLSEIKKNDLARKQVIEVNRIENEGDVVYRKNLTKLFREEKDPIELIKWKHIYEQLELCLDSCEDVANIIDGVIVKYV